MEHESNIQKLDFAVLVPQAQRGDSRAVNSLLLGFTPMVRAFKYNSYYVYLWSYIWVTKKCFYF